MPCSPCSSTPPGTMLPWGGPTCSGLDLPTSIHVSRKCPTSMPTSSPGGGIFSVEVSFPRMSLAGVQWTKTNPFCFSRELSAAYCCVPRLLAYAAVCLSVQLLEDASGFRLLAALEKAAVNICVHVLQCTYIFSSFGKTPKEYGCRIEC